MKILKRLLRPLESRKVRVAIATVVAAYAAEYGFKVSEAVIVAIVGTGISLILGIAHEDNGKNGATVLNLEELVEATEKTD